MTAGKRLKENPMTKTISSIILPTIIATIAATVITNIFSTEIANRVERKDLLTSIQNLYIGSSKEWIDSKLGQATFTHAINEDYYECVYAVDIAIVRIFYDTNASSCQAFFITSYNLKPSEKILFPKQYSKVVAGKPLGEFSFYDIESSPTMTYGFVSTGPGRAFYGEEYDFYHNVGTGYNFYFMIMDYGTLDSLTKFVTELDNSAYAEHIDDEVSLDQTMGPCITQRKNFFPNTYGVSHIYDEQDACWWFADYYSFDSLQLRINMGNDFSK